MSEPKRLFRNPDNKIIAGVCTGIADYFNIDVVFVRIIAFVAAFCGGAGIVAYLAAWIIVPQKTA